MTIKRVTVALDDRVVVAVRNRQARLIPKTNGAVSFSGIVNSILAKQLRVKLDD